MQAAQAVVVTAVPTAHPPTMPQSLSMRETCVHPAHTEEAFEIHGLRAVFSLAWQLRVLVVVRGEAGLRSILNITPSSAGPRT